jgi:hypothetical protein
LIAEINCSNPAVGVDDCLLLSVVCFQIGSLYRVGRVAQSV